MVKFAVSPVDAVKIVGYLAALGVVSWGWIEIAGRLHSEITHRIKTEVREMVVS